MKYKALLLDYDGTTAPYSNTDQPVLPSPKVTAVLKKASRKIHVGLATSRPLAKITLALKHLHLAGYSILLNGTQIITSDTLKTIRTVPLTQDAVKQIYHIVTKHNTTVNYTDFLDDHPATSLNQIITKPIADIFLQDIPESKFDQLQSALSHVSSIATFKLHSRRRGFCEMAITDIKASKQEAVIYVAKLLHIKTKEIIGVGDGYNDYPLLMACGLKIAMGNAVPELKAIADFVAPSVDEDGVATIVEKFILR